MLMATNHTLFTFAKKNPIMSNSNEVLLLSLIVIFLSVSSVSSSPVPKQTTYNRPDPLSHHFRHYHGGYNITDKHYWASALFTGAHGYAMAAIWILAGLGFGIFMITRKILRRVSSTTQESEIAEHSDYYYYIPFLVVVLCTLLVIVASSFIFVGSHNALKRAKKLENIILKATKHARQKIRKVTHALHEMQKLLRPYNEIMYYQLKSTSKGLNKELGILGEEVFKHQQLLELAFKVWYGLLVGIVSVNLVLVVAGLAFVLVHWRPGLIMIIILCWILITLCWIFTGFQFFLLNFAEDTCTTFKEYQQDPADNIISSVLPCADEAFGKNVMAQIGSMIYQFIDKMNSKVASFIQVLGLSEQKGDSGSNILRICNPFSGAPNYVYNPNGCSNGEIPIKEVPNVLAKFTCYKGNSTLSCLMNQKFISEDQYNMSWAYSQSIQDLLNVLPDVKNLTQCMFVRETLYDVLWHYCDPFRVSLRMVWSSFVALSIIMVVLELAWITKGYQNKGRSFVAMFSIAPRRTR